MVYTYALCIILALSSALGNQAQVDQLVDQISTSVANEIVKVINTDKAAKNNPVQLNTLILDTTNSALKKMEPQIKELGKLGGDPADIAKSLANKISHNQDLQASLPSGGKNAPRVIGAAVIGVTQLVTDFVKTLLTHY